MPRRPLRPLPVAVLAAAVGCTSTAGAPSDPRPAAPAFVDAGRTGATTAPRVRLVRAPSPPPDAIYADPAARTDRARAATAAARWHLAAQAAALGYDDATLASTEVALIHDLGRGPIVVKLAQRVGGVPVARTALAIVMDRSFALVAINGELAPVRPAATAPAFALAPEAALARAIADTGAAPGALAAAAAAVPDPAGFRSFTGAGLRGPARARPVLFPVGDQLVAAFQTEVLFAATAAAPMQGYHHVIAADDGRVLFRTATTRDAATSYRVWAAPAGDQRPADGPLADYTPHPTGAPDGFFPSAVAPSLVTVDGLDHPPSGGTDPWLPAGATATTGNNVDAYADLQFPDGFSAGDVRPNPTAPGVFDRVYDLTHEPAAGADQIKAAVTHLFYVNNWLHDWWYDSGFTEAAGNAQANNYGRGGIAGDPILAEGQDASGTNNANMDPRFDGASPVMQMYTWDPAGGASPDGTIDTNIIAHEFGHYWHLRLVDCGSHSCYAMSEGWGDFDALLANVHAGDDLDGVYAMGAYVLPSFTANSAYFGIRRYPYSRDVDKSPLTFRHMASGEPLPIGPAHSDVSFLQGADNWEVHDAGEIWCSMLFTGLVDLLEDSQGPTARYTFDEARRRYADYLVAGMIATPVEPTFTVQRDAILAAALAADPIDHAILVNAYAKRGFGTGAVSPPPDSFDGSGIVEDFGPRGVPELVAATLDEDPGCDTDGILDAGETGALAVTLRNTGVVDLVATQLTVDGAPDGFVFLAGTTATFPTIAPGATATIDVPVRLDEVQPAPTRPAFALRLHEPASPLSPVVATATADANLDVTPASAATDDVESPSPVWGGSGQIRRAALAATHVWSAPPPLGVTDATLVSPALAIGTAPVTIAFRSRHKLGPGDGVVLEYSHDGIAWADVSAIGTADYTGTVPASGGNPLAGRMAWTGTAGYPGFVTRTVELGTALAGTTTYLRFRLGGDAVSDGTAAWQIDDIAITGAGTPFPTTAPDDGSCLAGIRPIADAGADATATADALVSLDGSGSHDTDGTVVGYHWSQASGPIINLYDVSSSTAHFVAPAFAVPQIVELRLVVTDDDNRLSLPDLVAVTVLPPGAPDAALPDAAVDAAPDAEAGPDAAAPPDAGTPGLDDGGGCCQTGGRGAPGGAALALAVLAAITRRRRT